MAGKRILVVDDDRKCAQLIRNWLEIAGHEAEEAYGGAAALQRLSRDRFDLVLIDFDMRDIQGDRVCSILRSEARYDNLPILIVTAHVERSEDLFREYGATDVIYKPLESYAFMSKVRPYLED